MKRVLGFIIAATLAFTLSMCSSATEEIPLQSYWKVNKMYSNGELMTLPQEQNSQMYFINNMDLSGVCGCNNFFASFYAQADKGLINIECKMKTRMMCPDMSYEEKFIENLDNAAKYTLEGEIMVIKDKDGNILFELEKTVRNREMY